MSAKALLLRVVEIVMATFNGNGKKLFQTRYVRQGAK